MWGSIKSNPLMLGLAGLAIIVFILGLFSYLGARDERIENQLIHKGEVQERQKHNQEVINHVQAAKEAVDRPEPTDVERMRNRYDRSRQNSQ